MPPNGKKVPQGSDSSRRSLGRLLIAALLVSPLLLGAVFFPNPLTDALVSVTATATLNKPVRVHGAHLEFPPSGQRTYFRVREIDLLPLCGAPDSTLSVFVKRHRLEDWLRLRDSRWVLTRAEDRLTLRLLKARAGEASIQAGLRFERKRLTRAAAAIWLPKAVWSRFPDLVERRFSRDAQGRRLFKLTWNDGRWRLWGRSAPVLEASWR